MVAGHGAERALDKGHHTRFSSMKERVALKTMSFKAIMSHKVISSASQALLWQPCSEALVSLMAQRITDLTVKTRIILFTFMSKESDLFLNHSFTLNSKLIRIINDCFINTSKYKLFTLQEALVFVQQIRLRFIKGLVVLKLYSKWLLMIWQRGI